MAGPIAVAVRVPPVLRTLTDGRANLDVLVPTGATVADVLDRVERDHPALRRALDELDGGRQSGLVKEADYQRRRQLIIENKLDEAGYGTVP